MTRQARNTPTLADVLRGAIASHLSDVHVALPGRVESYDATTRKASVQPLVRRGYYDEEGQRVAERLPVVTGVPVVFPGAGGYRVRFPVAAGDLVLLIFSEASIDKWVVQGGDVDPRDDRRHSLSDGVAIPGLADFATAASEPPSDDGVLLIETESEIHAGGDQALATKADIDALITAFNSHAHTGVTGGGGTSGPPATPAASAAGTQVLKGS